MDRTYNPIVDNGLYVLAHYLEKDIEDITYEDIEKTLDFMCNKVTEFLSCERYSNLKNMLFTNSVLTQKTEKTLQDQLRYFLSNKGNDYCEKCGKYHANLRNDIGRSYFPNTTAHGFYNFSNNLLGLNICPYCIVLSMYSVMNCRVSKDVIMYNSDDNSFMSDYTYEIQNENISDILSNAKKYKDKEKPSSTKTLENLLEHSKIYDGYIEQNLFNNSGQSQFIEINGIDSKNVQILNTIIKEGLLKEFIKFGMLYDMLKNRLENIYIYKIYKDDELICTWELFDVLNKEVNSLDNKIIAIIKDITEKIEILDTKKLKNRLKLLSNFTDYENFLISISEEYAEKTGKKLFEIDEYILLDNIRKYKQIKNLILISLI